MSEAQKTIVVYGLLAKNEGTYGGGVTVTTTDGIMLAGLPTLDKAYEFEGERLPSPGTYGVLRRAAPGGSVVTGTFAIEGKGAGTTYSGGVKPPNVHEFLLASGFDGTQGGTSWAYTPTAGPSGFGSLGGEVYARGEKWPLSGVYSSMSFSADSPSPVVFEFASAGILGTRADAAVPAIVYPALTVVPPLAQNLTFTIDGVATLVVRSVKYDHGDPIDAKRVNLNGTTNPFAGYVRTRRKPVLQVTVENPLTTTFDAITKETAGTEFATTLAVGSVAFNRFNLSLPQGTLMAVPNDDDPISLLDITVHAHVSDPLANDDVVLTFD